MGPTTCFIVTLDSECCTLRGRTQFVGGHLPFLRPGWDLISPSPCVVERAFAMSEAEFGILSLDVN